MNTRPLRLDLLRKLAELLRNLPPKKFYYGEWYTGKMKGEVDLNACGTTACALGWATTLPECGLAFTKDDDDECPVIFAKEEEGKDAYGCQAAAYVFGLSPREAIYLFLPYTVSHHRELLQSPSESASALEVAEHIERFCTWKEKHLEEVAT